MNNAKGGTGMNGHPIGTRVRIVRSRCGYTTGKLATVIGPLRRFVDGKYGQCVNIDGYGTVNHDNGRTIVCPMTYMVPIRDDWDTDATPNAVASWAGGVWTPERVRA
jgi:hypothetical protein